MATLSNAFLKTQVNLPARQAVVTVTCDLRFRENEQFNMLHGLRFRLDCKVWGEDLGWWLDPDDFLFSFASKFYPDATPTQLEKIIFETTVPMSKLNEDSGTDEVYAELILTNLENGNKQKKRTNVIRHQFAT